MVSGGIPAAIGSLKLYPDDLGLNRQGLALLMLLLSEDPKAKVNLHNARQIALTNGIVDVVHQLQRRFPDEEDVAKTTSHILDLLIIGWS